MSNIEQMNTADLHLLLELRSAPLHPSRSEFQRERQWVIVAALTDELLARGEIL